ncbi:MAG TPA: 3-oxoacyl-ACP synthase III [Elusimicrobia bacterium]|nr:3-oxoacyl-ACP synthase III [Elusimicrobiota bacterium]HBT60334.1 3-oxoacyl-ACP synthase III [Elusimicrobiota bacterium]
MRYSKVFLDAVGYELAPDVVASSALEERVAPVYRALGMQAGQLEALTGIRERRWWEPGFPLSEGAIRAGRKALSAGNVQARDLGALIYAGVCREASEPATACAVAHALGAGPACAVYDLSNACLGVMNAIFELANAIEIGAMRAGLVVSCESAREINDSMIASMLQNPSMEHFRLSIATLTGGSGAVGVLVTDGSFGRQGRRLLGGLCRTAPQHYGLCRWHRDSMSTDAAAVLKHGVALGRETWRAFLKDMGWSAGSVDKTICHQVGAPHRSQVLSEMGVPLDKDFQTYEYLGNIGTVSLPLTAAIAEERGFLEKGDKVAFLGIGSGLNCLMLGWEW